MLKKYDKFLEIPLKLLIDQMPGMLVTQQCQGLHGWALFLRYFDPAEY